jgi:hypothetical protein
VLASIFMQELEGDGRRRKGKERRMKQKSWHDSRCLCNWLLRTRFEGLLSGCTRQKGCSSVRTNPEVSMHGAADCLVYVTRIAVSNDMGHGSA